MIPLAHVGSGTLEPLQLVPVLVAVFAYWARAATLARHGKPVAVGRQVSFASGLILIVAGLVSPVAHLGEELFLAHMGQHLVIGDIAPILIAIGLTGPLLAPILRNPVVARLKTLAHPGIAFPLWLANLYFWHLPFAYQGALNSPLVHAVEHGAFIGFGILMWMPVFGPLPTPSWFGLVSKLIYVVGVRFGGALLANALMWSGTALYPDYAPGVALWDISLLADQGTAGVIMLIEGSLVTLGVIAWVFLQAADQAEKSQDLIDEAERLGVELDPARAKRAVAAGRGAELRERILSGAGLPGSGRGTPA
ncbi:MAG: cytochrome c oxidase assembly protein [Solirubrobacterales bacterium]